MDCLSKYDLTQVILFLKKLNTIVNLSEFPSYLTSILPLIINSDFTLLAGTDPSLVDNAEKSHKPQGGNKLLAVPLATNDVHCLSKVNITLPYFLQNPVTVNYLLTGDRSAKKISDFLNETELRQRDALYGEFLEPLCLLDQMSIVVSAQNQFTQKRQGLNSAFIDNLTIRTTPSSVYLEEELADLVIIIHREKRDFRDRDRELLNLVSSHILQAYQNSQMFSRINQDDNKSLYQVLNQTCSLDVRPDGSIGIMPEQAEKLISKFFPSSTSETYKLPEVLTNWIQRNLRNLSIDSDFSNPIPPLITVKDKHTLTIRLHINHDNEQYVLVLEEQTPLNLSFSVLQELGLTKRETEILHWIIRDRSNQQISEILNLSNRTVQKHCENIYSKLGVHNRAASITKTIQKLGIAIVN